MDNDYCLLSGDFITLQVLASNASWHNQWYHDNSLTRDIVHSSWHEGRNTAGGWRTAFSGQFLLSRHTTLLCRLFLLYEVWFSAVVFVAAVLFLLFSLSLLYCVCLASTFIKLLLNWNSVRSQCLVWVLVYKYVYKLFKKKIFKLIILKKCKHHCIHIHWKSMRDI